MKNEVKFTKGNIVSEHHPEGHSFYDQTAEVQHTFEEARIAVFVNQDYANGVELAKKSIKLCTEAQWYDGLGRALMFLAQCYQRIPDYKKAFESYESAIEVFKKQGMQRSLAFAKNNIGNLYGMTLDYFSAARSYQEAIDFSLQSDDFNSTIQFQMNLTNIYIESGNLDLAFVAAKLTLEWMEKYNYQDYRSTALHNMSRLFIQMKRYTEADDYADLSKSDIERFPNQQRWTNFHLLKSTIALNQGKFKEGIPHSEAARNLSIESASPFYEGQAIQNAASLYEGLGQTERAIKLYKECCSIFNKIEAWDQLSIASGNFAKLYLKQEKKEAFLLFKRSLELATNVGSKHLISEAHLNLYYAYKQTNNIDLALHHHELYHLSERERINNETEQQFALLQSKQESENLRLDARTQKLRTEHLESQLTSQATQLVTQTELLSKFRDELREIVRQSSSQDPTIRAIKEKLKELPCESVDWAKFEKEFTAVHPEFRAKLMEKYPELTKQEIKMCQLARLGLKTYEMSRLLCLSERTIDGHRNSLRKKLGLKPQENLKDFLQSIR